MKKAFIKWMSSRNWIYKLSVKLIANRIVYSKTILTPKYLADMGWIEECGFFFEPNIKSRDKIWIQFENHYFRIWHGHEKTFIGLESSVEWFENYYLIIHPDNGRYDLSPLY